jgi:hypothetical protein
MASMPLYGTKYDYLGTSPRALFSEVKLAPISPKYHNVNGPAAAFAHDQISRIRRSAGGSHRNQQPAHDHAQR